MDIAALAVVGAEDAQIRRQRVVGSGEIGRAADRLGHDRVDNLERQFRRFAGRDVLAALHGLLLERADAGGELFRRLHRKDAIELGAPAVRQGLVPRVPVGMGLRAAGPHGFPLLLDLVRHLERAVGPAVGFLGGGKLCRIGQRTMALGRVLCGVTQRDVGLAGDHRRARIGLGRGDGGVDGIGVMAVDVLHVPARGRNAGRLVRGIGQRDIAVDGDAVVVEEQDQARQLLHPRKRDGLLADPLHQAAVAGHDVGVVVDDLRPPVRAQRFLGDGEPHGIADALSQRAGRRFDPGSMAVLGVPSGARAPLAKIPDLVERHVRVAGQVHQGIEQHRPVPRRQDEPVAVGPVRGGWIEPQVPVVQDGRHVGHADRHPRMARVRGGHGIERQGADRGGAGPVIGMRGAQSGNVQGKILSV